MRKSSQPQRAEPALVSAIRFHLASHEDRLGGLHGWVTFDLAGLCVDGAAVRKTACGHVALSYPTRVRHGRRYTIVWPRDEAMRRAIEREVIGFLRGRGHVP